MYSDSRYSDSSVGLHAICTVCTLPITNTQELPLTHVLYTEMDNLHDDIGKYLNEPLKHNFLFQSVDTNEIILIIVSLDNSKGQDLIVYQLRF